MIRLSVPIWVADCYRASEYRTISLLIRWWSEYCTICPLFRCPLITGLLPGIWIPDTQLSAFWMVPLFKCLVFGSPLYSHILGYQQFLFVIAASWRVTRWPCWSRSTKTQRRPPKKQKGPKNCKLKQKPNHRCSSTSFNKHFFTKNLKKKQRRYILT